MAARNQGKGTYHVGANHFTGDRRGRPLQEWVLQFKDGLFYVADDEEPTQDLSKAFIILGKVNASHETQIVAEQWNEPVRAIRKEKLNER